MGSAQVIGLKVSGYEIVEELGIGTSTTSYLARDPSGKCIVAKRLLDTFAADDAIVKKFFETSDLSSKIRMKKFIASVTGQNKIAEGIFLLREHIEGQPLSHYIKNGLLGELDWYQLSCDLCDAVRAMSSRGVIHGGIHPKNVIITSKGRVKLTDFSTGAYQLQGKIGKQYRRTALSYLAPEQWRGEAGDPQTDIYSVGLIISTLKTGAESFNAAAPDDLKKQILEGVKTDCPVIAAAIDPVPSRRYPEISKFRSSLSNLRTPPEKTTAPNEEEELKKRKEAEEKKKKELEKREQQKKQREEEKRRQEIARAEQEAKDREKQKNQGNAPTPPQEAAIGVLKAIHDINDNSKDLLAKSAPYVLTVPKNGKISQRALQLANGGTGLLRLSAKCNGKGVSINMPQLEIPPGQMRPVVITLNSDSDEWVNVAFHWQEARDKREIELKFYRPG